MCWGKYLACVQNFILVEANNLGYQPSAIYVAFRLLCILAYKNHCCVGDDDQSIYCGVVPTWVTILTVRKGYFPWGACVRVEHNINRYKPAYSSRQASGVIAGNEGRVWQDVVERNPAGQGKKSSFDRALGWEEERALGSGDESKRCSAVTRALDPYTLDEHGNFVRPRTRCALLKDRFLTIGLHNRVELAAPRSMSG